jgi:D-alanine-D-alanine ligase-like ATP-grasp enzyme
VEEFIAGREITCILLEGMNKKVYLAEKVFQHLDDKYLFTTFEDQWLISGTSTFRYAKYDDPILREYVKKAFDVTGMYDYGKFDVRLDQSGRYFFIDANCNPAFGPKELEVALSVILDMYGISFYEILKRLMLNTMRDALGRDRLPYMFENDAVP